jgi:fructose-specific phosphotransferase system IIC component
MAVATLCHMPSREAVLGFLCGLVVLMIAFGILGDFAAGIADGMIPLIIAGWIVFSIRDWIRGRTESSA